MKDYGDGKVSLARSVAKVLVKQKKKNEKS